MKKIRGTRDIFPYSAYQKIYHFLRSSLLLHNFQEIHTPIFEPEEIFLKNLGAQTDIVNKEMYYVNHLHQTTDEEKIVLRPELTASMMRAYLENNLSAHHTPLKMFQIGEVFRHERPQKGRYREFFQCSIECLNAESIAYDAELIVFLHTLFQSALGDTFTLEINYIANAQTRIEYKKKLYKFCMEKAEAIGKDYILGLGENHILRILDHKDQKIKEILCDAPAIELFFSEEDHAKWNQLQTLLKECNVPFKRNNYLVRGLDYYNGTVFEFKSKFLGAQSTFCGGGRYDDLAKNFSEKLSIPSLGAGIGIDRILIMLEEINKEFLIEKKISYSAILFESEPSTTEYLNALKIKKLIIENSIKSEIYFDKKSLKSGLKKANNENVDFVIIIQKNSFIFKDMQKSKEQHEVTLESIPYYLNDYL